MFTEKKLEKLVNAGVISLDQKKEILDFDDGSSFLSLKRVLSFLGFFAVALGIISFIAANWEDISRATKISTMFIILFSTSYFAYYYYKKQNYNLYETVLAFLFLLLLAALGLLIQTFNITGKNFYPLLGYWCLLGTPLVIASEKHYISYIYIPAFLLWCFLFLYDITPKNILYPTLLYIYISLAYISHRFYEKNNKNIFSDILKKNSLFAFYFTLFCYLLENVSIHLLYNPELSMRPFLFVLIILIALHLWYLKNKKTKLLKTNFKMMLLWCFLLFLYLGAILGLFNSGISLILYGTLLLIGIKIFTYLNSFILKEKKHD